MSGQKEEHMGANMDCRTFRMNDRKKIEKEWASKVEDSRHEDGTSYSGCIGMLGTKIAKWHDLKLASENKAHEYISEHQEKWEPAIAVSFYLAAKPTPEQQGRAKVAEANASKLQQAFVQTTRKVAEAIKAHGGFVRCPLCQSSLNVQKISSIRCVFCPGKARVPYSMVEIYDGAGYLTTPEQQKEIEEAAKVAIEAEKACRELQKPQPSTEIGWVVGGWCSS
jgi:hypothetical protein